MQISSTTSGEEDLELLISLFSAVQVLRSFLF
jgi:hypothetical protein